MNLKSMLGYKIPIGSALKYEVPVPNVVSALRYPIPLPNVKFFRNAALAIIVVGLCLAQGYAVVKSTKIEEGVSAITESLPTLSNKISAVDARVTKLETTTKADEGGLADLRETVVKLQMDLAALKGTSTEVTTLKKKVSSISYRLYKLQKKPVIRKK